MIHLLLLFIGAFCVIIGIVLCALLISFGMKWLKRFLLITVPGIVITTILALNSACHILHLPPILPHQKQIADGIRWTLDAAALPLVAFRIYEWWQKKQEQKKQEQKKQEQKKAAPQPLL